MAKAKTRTRTVYVRTKGRRKKKNGFVLPLAIMAPLVATGQHVYLRYQRNGATPAIHDLLGAYTGYNFGQRKWDPWYLKLGGYPLLAGAVAHYVANKTGVNRAIARSKIPVIRI